MEKSSKNNPIIKTLLVLVGIGVIAFSVYHYFDLVAWEKSGDGPLVMTRFSRVLYDLGGPLAAAGGIALAGVLCIYYALAKYGKNGNNSNKLGQ